MTLAGYTYGKDRVRIMRVHRDRDRHEVRELTVKVMLEGAFAGAFAETDNSSTIATDTIKNIVNIVARENLNAPTEPFCLALAERFLARYPQIDRTSITAHETKWVRLKVADKPHAHSFVLDANGRPCATVGVTRGAAEIRSGVQGFTFMKSTGSGWTDYVMDEYTTLPETRDRICATSMDAAWLWSASPTDYPMANARVLQTMLEVFATTYSESVQNSLYRMGEAVLAAFPEVSEVSMACPNKHYLRIDLVPFGLDNDNQVFLPTEEPHGQIECTVRRSEPDL